MTTIGKKLREARIKKGASLSDAERATKIKASFLSAIESGEFHKLPSAYVQGFVSNYIDYLDLPRRDSLALFRREYDASASYKVLPENLTDSQSFSRNRLRFSPRMLVFLGFFIVLCGFLAYQFRFVYLSPPLDVAEPTEGQVVTSEIVVKGTTDPNASLTVNKDAVTINPDGTFTKTVRVFPGESVITITAQNRVGKQTVITREVQAR